VGGSVADRPRAVVGDCRYCTARDGRPTGGSKLYGGEPLKKFPDGSMAHVACEIDARRHGVSFW
jgi:hypothetical protein